MLDLQFVGLNLHFAVNLLAALVSFGVFWLIFDAWTVRHSRIELIKWVGFLALSIGFLLRATALRSQEESFTQYVELASNLLRLVGYVAIVLGQVLEPLQKKPVYDNANDSLIMPAKLPAVAPVAFAPVTGLLLPLLTGLISGLYWRRATTGLERHLKPVAWGFAALTVFELLNNLTLLQGTTNPNLYQLVQTYGPAWWVGLAALLTGSLILGMWVWRYLTKRLQSQLFIVLVAETLALFLISTIGFTFLLMQNVRSQSLADLGTASRVLEYAITSRQAETAAQAEAVASNTAVATAVGAADHKALVTILEKYMPSHGLTTLTVTDASGRVLLRGEDPERWGDSRSSDVLIRRGSIGEATSSVVVREGVIAPSVTLVAATPIRDAAGTIVGVVTAGRAISNAFVDGIRTSTGLDSAVYGGNVRAATTLVATNGTDRAVGIKETSTVVNQKVLKDDKSHSGVVALQNRSYLAAFTPLRDVNNVPVGMLLVARPQDALYAAADESIRLTFLFVVVLVFVSIYPVYLISRYLSGQLR